MLYRVEERLRQLAGREQEDAARLFVLISGLRGLEDATLGRLSMVNVMENEVFRRNIEKGIAIGREQGRAKGEATFLAKMLEAKFGAPLSAGVAERIAAASPDQLEKWLLPAVKADRLEDVF